MNYEIGLFELAFIGLALINGVLVPILFLMNRTITKINTDLIANKLYVENNYTKKDDLKDEFEKISKKLGEIWTDIKELRNKK